MRAICLILFLATILSAHILIGQDTSHLAPWADPKFVFEIIPLSQKASETAKNPLANRNHGLTKGKASPFSSSDSLSKYKISIGIRGGIKSAVPNNLITKKNEIDIALDVQLGFHENFYAGLRYMVDRHKPYMYTREEMDFGDGPMLLEKFIDTDKNIGAFYVGGLLSLDQLNFGIQTGAFFWRGRERLFHHEELFAIMKGPICKGFYIENWASYFFLNWISGSLNIVVLPYMGFYAGVNFHLFR